MTEEQRTIYVANDGKRFYVREECIEYESINEIVQCLLDSGITEIGNIFEDVVTELLKHYNITPKNTLHYNV